MLSVAAVHSIPSQAYMSIHGWYTENLSILLFQLVETKAFPILNNEEYVYTKLL